ncbi:linker for activation of T-cells family member 1 isoform X2 [Cuculus canorus]|uniref:linker for activation of T-cells family member 1 isoform X2 n=1 Tax=Cuculus canorus TaxID=55661 RepID=UPI0023AA3C70|nr:linker for activation of T-cells family member 1 isoform X2 [Cuculus canorus]XP_053908989.1 linker for activation of T-cells family member 1 isoform X2 [Cuculus canorus]
MEAPLPHSGLWGLALLPPTLLLAALCARCRRGYGVQVDNYEYKPPHSVAPSSFIVMGPRYSLPHRSCPTSPPRPPQPTAAALGTRNPATALPPPSPRIECRRRSSPSPRGRLYERRLRHGLCVLPEPEGAGPSAPPSEEYENLPDDRSDSRADSLEYINLPPPGSAPASESEDGAPDYENL